MVAVMFMSFALIALLCVLAYTLAIYALPFFVGLAAAQFAWQTGSGLIGAGLVGLFETFRTPVIRLIVAIVFAAPAAVAGYALVHGITKEAVPSEIWRQIFCIVGGGCVGIAAGMRLAAGVGQPVR